MTQYEAWKEKRSQTQGLPVKDLSDCSRENLKSTDIEVRGCMIMNITSTYYYIHDDYLYLALSSPAEAYLLIAGCFDTGSLGSSDILFL